MVNPMTPVCGRWADWEDTYEEWLKHAVSHNNFGRGHSGGQALAMDTEAGEITATLKLFLQSMYYVCLLLITLYKVLSTDVCPLSTVDFHVMAHHWSMMLYISEEKV